MSFACLRNHVDASGILVRILEIERTSNEIIEQVNDLLEEEFEIEKSEFAPEASMKEVLQLDSINLVDLVALVQYTYKITIPAEDLPKMKTFNDLYDYIEQHLEK